MRRAQKQRRHKQHIASIFLNISCSLCGSYPFLIPACFLFLLFHFLIFGVARGHGLAANSCDTFQKHGSQQPGLGLTHILKGATDLQWKGACSALEAPAITWTQAIPLLFILLKISFITGNLIFRDG
jgi:hypothetical protein